MQKCSHLNIINKLNLKTFLKQENLKRYYYFFLLVLINYCLLIFPHFIRFIEENPILSKTAIILLYDNFIFSLAISAPILAGGIIAKAYSIFILGILSILSLLIALNYKLFGHAISKDALISLFSSFSTNYKDFLSFYINTKIFFLISLITIIYVVICFFILKIRYKLSIKFLIFSLLFSVFIFFIDKYPYPIYKLSFNRRQANIFPFYILNSYFEYLVALRKIKQYEMKFGSNLKFEIDTSNTNIKNIVLIIGESLSRSHFNIYGYAKETTPLLKKRDDVVWFNNVISPSTYTSSSILSALTFGNSIDDEQSYALPSLIDIMKKAGYRTYAISNQWVFGTYDDLPSAIMKRAEKTLFLRAYNRHDEALIDPYKNILYNNKEKKFIILHMIASHFNYKDRYPPEFSFFNDNKDKIQNTINQYDNSIRYVDYVVNSTLQILSQKNESSIAIFFSDHGEEVYDFRNLCGHHHALASKFMYEIPFGIFLSKEFIKKYPTFKNKISGYINRKFSTSNLIHTVLDLAQIKVPFFEPSKSLINNKYKELNLSIPKESFSRITLNSNPYFPKLWINYVNSVERLKKFNKDFLGFEMDIVYEPHKKCFDVRHPPTPTQGLCLNDLIKELNQPEKYYFWLDYKNLDTFNARESLEVLESIIKKFNIKRTHIIVESRIPKALTLFTEKGYYTSFYLPKLKTTDYVNKMMSEVEKIRLMSKGAKFHMISQSAQMLDFMNTYFKDDNKLIWALEKNLSNENYYKSVITKILKDKSVKVLLIHLPT